MPGNCEIKGPLGFLVLWIVSKESMNGAGISEELEKRRGSKPSPGTIYPVLKEHKEEGYLEQDEDGIYHLTKEGKTVLKRHAKMLCTMLYDMDEIKKFAK